MALLDTEVWEVKEQDGSPLLQAFPSPHKQRQKIFEVFLALQPNPAYGHVQLAHKKLENKNSICCQHLKQEVIHRIQISGFTFFKNWPIWQHSQPHNMFTCAPFATCYLPAGLETFKLWTEGYQLVLHVYPIMRLNWLLLCCPVWGAC